MNNSHPESTDPSPSSLATGAADATPWYRQFWPWVLITFPLLAVIGSAITITLAVRTADGLVVDDYYKEGLGINRTLAMEDTAQALGLTASAEVDRRLGRLRLQLQAAQPFASPPMLELRLIHPTRKNLDAQTRLLRDTAGPGYVGKWPALPAADWHVQLEPEDGSWRLSGRLWLPADATPALRWRIGATP
ncbi:MAG: FixH family protein [Pseudomonadota bacterium]|nr:MAG: FixH family protein [Pseudomonadota bacterium]